MQYMQIPLLRLAFFTKSYTTGILRFPELSQRRLNFFDFLTFLDKDVENSWRLSGNFAFFF